MSAPKELIKIGEFARRAGTNLRTLRYYEEIGLLGPAHRSSGGFRYYRPTDVHRLRMVHTLQELRLPMHMARQRIIREGISLKFTGLKFAND